HPRRSDGPYDPDRPSRPGTPHRPHAPEYPGSPDRPAGPDGPYGRDPSGRPDHPHRPARPAGPHDPRDPYDPDTPALADRPHRPHRPHHAHHPRDPEAASPHTPELADRRADLEPAVLYALAHLGDAFRMGGAGPRWWDCSGLVQQAYRRAGVRLPRVAADQYRAVRRIPRTALRRGDLVFWSRNGRASGVHHVAIYLGQGRYIEAPHPGRNVRVSTFSRYRPNLYGRIR
ncbi:NlpC/P60 family protein, partial [Streptomyces gamaensis]